MAAPNVVPIREAPPRRKRSELAGLPASKYANPAAEAAVRAAKPAAAEPVDLMGALGKALTRRAARDDAGMRIKRKTDQCGRLVQRLKARAAAFKSQAAALNRRAAVALARVERIEGRAVMFMDDSGSKSLIGIEYTLTMRPNAASVKIDDVTKIPPSYLHPEKPAPPREPDKVAIKVALERGSRKEATEAEKAIAAELRQAVHLEQTVSLLVSRVE